MEDQDLIFLWNQYFQSDNLENMNQNDQEFNKLNLVIILHRINLNIGLNKILENFITETKHHLKSAWVTDLSQFLQAQLN